MTSGQDPAQAFIDKTVTAALEAAAPLPIVRRSGQPPPARSGPLEIAIPIYGGADALEACLEALLPTISPGDQVWLLDDASNDPAVDRLLQDFASLWPGTRLERNTENLGFVGNANKAMELTGGDLVLLNSDTVPLPGWLEHLQASLDANPRAGIACPVSDQATILSAVPEGNDGAAELATRLSAGDPPLPTAVGFCMLIRRALLKEAGHFSDDFAPGYGEENDLSMRAQALGYEIIAAGGACVLHRSGGSFGEQRSRALQRSHQQLLDQRWPQYTPLVQAWWRDDPLCPLRERLAGAGDARPVILHVLHRQYLVGGTERVARSTIASLCEDYRHVLLYPGDTTNAWCDFELRGDQSFRELMLNKRWIRPKTQIASQPADLSCAQAERALARMIRGTGARVVHFHHFMHWDSLLLPELAQTMGCKVLISVHDFWFNCPVHNQLEYSTGEPCGRSHAMADRRCGTCLAAWSGDNAEEEPRDRLARYAISRHRILERALGKADAVLAPSHFIRNKILAAFDLPDPDRLHVQPHGVAVPVSRAFRPAREPVTVGYFGGDQRLKGADIAVHIAAGLADLGVQLRVHGRTRAFDPDRLPANMHLHGFYDGDRIGDIMRRIDLAIVPSHYEESFSLILSECWAHGVPVISSARGALRERVIHGVNGWLVKSMDPAEWLRVTRAVIEEGRIDDARKHVLETPVVSASASARKVAALYEKMLADPARAPEKPRGSSVPPHFRRSLRALRSREIRPDSPWMQAARRHARHTAERRCLGIVRDHWGTAHYRVRFPLVALAHAGECAAVDFHVVRESGFKCLQRLDQFEASHVMVQPFITDDGLAMMEDLARRPKLHITLVIDDLWTDLPPQNPVRAQLPSDVHDRLRYAASMSHALVLTTPTLRERLEVPHPFTHVIDNALPGELWRALEPVNHTTCDGRVRVGWAGAPQHAGDLAFLDRVMAETADRVDWVLLGMCPEGLRDRVAEFQPMRPFAEYPAALSSARLDLAIAPLADNPFNRCKSRLKALEYGALGIPVIAADLEPYRDCPVTLAPSNDVDAWVERIRELAGSPEKRKSDGEKLRRWVLENHVMEQRVADWSKTLGAKDDAG